MFLHKGGILVQESLKYRPEYNLLQDAYLGSNDVLKNKLDYLAAMAQPEQWDYKGKTGKQIYMLIL